MSSFYGTTTNRDICNNLFKDIDNFNLPLVMLLGICTEGEPTMTEGHAGLIAVKVQTVGCPTD